MNYRFNDFDFTIANDYYEMNIHDDAHNDTVIVLDIYDYRTHKISQQLSVSRNDFIARLMHFRFTRSEAEDVFDEEIEILEDLRPNAQL